MVVPLRGGVPGGGGTVDHEGVFQVEPGHHRGVNNYTANLQAMNWGILVAGDKLPTVMVGSGP